MKKKVILHMVRELEVGGIQSLILNVYSNMDKEKFQFDFLVSSEGVLDQKVRDMNSNIFYIPYITKVGPYKYAKNLREFFLKHKEYNIVHVHFDQFSGLIAKVAKQCGVEVVISHAHIINNTTNLLGKIYKKILQKDLLKYSTKRLACSKKAADWLFNGEEAVILKNGIDVEKFFFNENKRKKIREELEINDNTILYGNIGRITKEKNQKFVIEIFNELYKKNNNSMLVIVGEGPLEKKLKRRTKKLNLQDKIIFLKNRSDIEYIYSAMDVFIFPSLFEGLGICLIEAQMAGLQCYTSDTIPKETKITDSIEYIKLKCSAKQWADKINNNGFNSTTKRKNTKIEDQGYNIRTTADILSRFYEEY